MYKLTYSLTHSRAKTADSLVELTQTDLSELEYVSMSANDNTRSVAQLINANVNVDTVQGPTTDFRPSVSGVDR